MVISFLSNSNNVSVNNTNTIKKVDDKIVSSDKSYIDPDWHVGRDITYDINFMPQVPTRVEQIVRMYFSETAQYSNSILGNLYNDDGAVYQRLYSAQYTNQQGDIAIFYDFYYDLHYTDIYKLYYDVQCSYFMVNDTSSSTYNEGISKYAIYYTAQNQAGKTVMSESDPVSGQFIVTSDAWYPTSPSAPFSGSVDISDALVSANEFIVRVVFYYNEKINGAFHVHQIHTSLDELKITFTNISSSQLHTEYKRISNSNVTHRMSLENPEYASQIVINKPDGWTINHITPSVSYRESGDKVYLENNTIPVTYQIYFDEDPSLSSVQSSESITRFSETTSDDTVLYTDGDGRVYDYSNDIYTSGDCADTQSEDNNVLSFYNPGGGGAVTDDVYFYISNNFNTTISLKVRSYTPSDTTLDTFFYAYNYTSSSYVLLFTQDDNDNQNYTYSTTFSSGCMNGTTVKIYITHGEGSSVEWYLDIDKMVLGSNTYSESFADVSDWGATGTSFTSDGDVATHVYSGAWSYCYSNSPSISNAKGYYVEVRIKTSMTATIYIQGYHSDGRSGGYSYQKTKSVSTSWITYKFLIITSGALECVDFSSGSSSLTVYIDYLRIAPADEMGWQHDGSTLTGIEQNAYANATSDGDLIRAERTGGSFGSLSIYVDSTTTKVCADPDYYPFIEFEVDDASTANYIINVFDQDSTETTLKAIGTEKGTLCYNLKAHLGNNELQYIFIKIYSGILILDYIQIYSIANFTYSAHSSITTADYCYVESGVLHFSRTTSYWFALNHDPSISVSTATYNVVNLTTSAITAGGIDDLYFTEYESGDGDTWFETRFAPVHTTIDDLAIGSYGSYSISAIKFWTISYAPYIYNIFQSATEIYEGDNLTISCNVNTFTDIYTMKLVPTLLPSGTSNTTVSMLSDGDVYYYTLTPDTIGKYQYKILADNAVYTDDAYVSFTVVEKTFAIKDYTYDYTSDEFFIKGTANKNFDYYLYDNNTSLQNGSLTKDNVFSIEQSKSSITGVHQLGLKCVNSTDILWINGSYVVSSSYGWTYINPYTASGEGLELTKFKLYINGSRVYDRAWKVYLDTSAAVNVTITDFFNATVYNSVHSWSRGIDVLVDVYTFKVVHNIDDEYIYFTLTSSGGSSYSEYIMPHEVVTYYLYTANTYTYSYTADLKDTGSKTYTGTITVSGDVAIVIADWGVERILTRLTDVENYAMSGGGSSSSVTAALSTAAIEIWKLRLGLFALAGVVIAGNIVVAFMSRNKSNISQPVLRAPVIKKTQTAVRKKYGKAKTTKELGEKAWRKYRK